MKKGTLPKILIALTLLITFGICMNLYIKKTQKIYLNLIVDYKFDEAYVMYKKNSKILSKNLLAYEGFYFYFEKHDYVSALKYFDLLKADLRYQLKDIFYEKVVIKLFEENHFDDAVFWHEQITGQNRDDFVLKFKEVAENLISTSETEKALKYYKILIDNKESDIALDDIYLKIINYFLDNSNFDSAVKFYKEAINSDTNLLDFFEKHNTYITKDCSSIMVLATKGNLPFYIGKYEVTQAEFKSIMGFNPSFFKGDTLPVEQVTWYDAVMYCNVLSEKKGLSSYYSIHRIKKNSDGNITDANVSISGGNGFRLPTSAEWEYAARGGNKSKGYKYSGSNNIDKVAWYWINSGDKILSGELDTKKMVANNCRTHPVGGKQANELGLYDMSGNVWEWCWDKHGSSDRVVRSGSWNVFADGCEVSEGFFGYPDVRSLDLGFRVLRTK